MRPFWFIFVLSILFTCGCRVETDTAQPELDTETRERCVEQMRFALANESQWVKVHAAEFLISLDYKAGVRDAFEAELAEYGAVSPYRIGIWRVLAQADRHDSRVYDRYVGQIHDAFMDEAGSDRIHAIESLAKLDYELPDATGGVSATAGTSSAETMVTEFARSGPEQGRAYALWVLLNNGGDEAEADLVALLTHDNPTVRLTAAYALRHQAVVTPTTLAALRKALQDEDAASPAWIYLATATLRHWNDTDAAIPDADKAELFAALWQRVEQGSDEARYEATRLLAGMPLSPSDVKKLIALLDRSDVSVDVKSSVAHAICRHGRRHLASMPLVDWLIVGLYGVGMLGIGVYYARRTKSADDYLLGGRMMKSWAVGLSLFATLLSTLSYLAWPGEMIKNGPIILMGYAAYPVVFLVVGWMLIPRIMKLEITSAYEILEKQLGLSVRLLGSTLFLSLRMLWMASIIYWTTFIVLLPSAGLDERYTIPFAALLGVVTVIYTTMGGLRAVVLTDVIQTFILFAGAIASLCLITYTLGGVTAWFPDQWPSHWSEPRLWFDFDPHARATLANAMLASFAWYVCTAGSDQMAIQRYLSTRDVAAARRSLAISLATDFIVLIFLGLMGLALLSFFSTYPHTMADGQTVYANADKLFPRFVVVGLPLGMSGLVIAGLLAAAMSSLSSGVNSSAAVISEDFVRRLHPSNNAASKGAEAGHVRLVRLTSVGVGIAAVLLSSLIGKVQGNMLEVIYKVVNLFVAPLFYLFFMAIFVPWANSLGTWIGACAGIATAVLIAFWHDFFGVQGISFLWIMPVSFTVAALCGCLSSFLLGGRRQNIRVEDLT